MAETIHSQESTGKSKRREKNTNAHCPDLPNTRKHHRGLLADTIGRSLCMRRIDFSTGEQDPDRVPLSLSRYSSKADSLLSPYLTAPSLASPSGETLTANSYAKIQKDIEIPHNRIVSADGNASTEDMERLATQYGQASHMGLHDPSYKVFINRNRTGGVCFKVLSKVAVVTGDPLCHSSLTPHVLREFKQYRRRFRWGIAFLGAGEGLVNHARQNSKKWTILQFGKERVLNPVTNEVICETAGKRILTQNRQLLNASKGGIILHIYTPSSHQLDLGLEQELRAVYDKWRTTRNQSGKPQAFITEYDPFLIPSLMSYIYTRGPHGKANGFAALRWIGAKSGYHVDPCVAAPGARKGITDLLLFACMAWLRQLGITYMSVGYEPSPLLNVAEGSGTPVSVAYLTQRIYRSVFARLPLAGKRAYFGKFKPDVEQDSPVFVIFPSRIPEPRRVVAVAHVSNISIRGLILGR
ncbi:hypothetical protein BJX99DRAFT_267562 [Aspergillus californicus]